MINSTEVVSNFSSLTSTLNDTYIPVIKLKNNQTKTLNSWEIYQEKHLEKLFGKPYCENVSNKKEKLRKHLKDTKSVENLLCMCYMTFAMNLVNASNTNDTYFYDRNILLDEWYIRGTIRATYSKEFFNLVCLSSFIGLICTCVLILCDWVRRPGATRYVRMETIKPEDFIFQDSNFVK